MINVFSDGSHLAPVNGQKPLKTKGSIVIYEDKKLVGFFTQEGKEGWSDTAEYVGIVLGLEKLKELNLQGYSITWFNDNQFVMRFMEQRRTGKASKDYYELACKAVELLKDFKDIKFKWIPREQNTFADDLSKL